MNLDYFKIFNADFDIFDDVDIFCNEEIPLWVCNMFYRTDSYMNTMARYMQPFLKSH